MTPKSPSEGGEQQSEGQARPIPCPECGSTRGYSRVGNFRSQCLNCNSLLKNSEVDMELPGTQE